MTYPDTAAEQLPSLLSRHCDLMLLPLSDPLDHALPAAQLAQIAAIAAGFTGLLSLFNIGGTGFTPIVNAPEVAILGVSKQPSSQSGTAKPSSRN